ncbi:MAG: DUF4139 domain-containing protein [Allosphingosinicella sp.]
MRPLRLLLLAGMLAAPLAADAQRPAISPAPQAVAVTVYRAPYRDASEPIQLQWLNGYALVSETRRVSVPAGESVIRFEGVAGGILPQSAIVAGFPEDVIEKNEDAWLLSPAALIDASLGKRVSLRRTSRATGKVSETEAVVRSGPQGAVVIQTADGVESLRCDGVPETLRYDGVPPGLSAKPTLSMRVRSRRAASATVTLSYLASEFDWQANYVATLAPDGKSLDLFAWLTLANGDDTSFPRAQTRAVAGRLNRQDIRAAKPRGAPLTLRCWPQGTTTSDLREYQPEPEEEIVVSGSRMYAMAPPPPPPPPPAPAPPPPMMAQQEELGDLKLYRIPEPVTVAAHSQKQVALLARKKVRVEMVYRTYLYLGQPGGAQPVGRTLRTVNDAASGLGLPLPAGGVALFTQAGGRRLLLGKGALDDKAVGEEIEIPFGIANGVTAAVKPLGDAKAKRGEWEFTARNARAEPVAFVLDFYEAGMKLAAEAPLATRNGRPNWVVTLPPNESRTLRFTVEKP